MDFITALIILTNSERAQPLRVDKVLVKIAEVRAERACFNWDHTGFQEYFATHTTPRYIYGGENLLKDFQTAKAAHAALMASGSHRENIVKKEYRRIGIAKARSCNAYAEIFSN